MYLLHKKSIELAKIDNDLNIKYKIYYKNKYDERVILLEDTYKSNLLNKEKDYKVSISKLNEKHKKIIKQMIEDHNKEKSLLLAIIKRR